MSNLDALLITPPSRLEVYQGLSNDYTAIMAYPGSQLYPMAINKGWDLPDSKGGPGWIGYSQHAYETLPLRTEHVKGSEVLEFRDKAFDTYFKNSDYTSMIKKTFGEKTNDHISKMLEFKLKRKHNFEKVNY